MKKKAVLFIPIILLIISSILYLSKNTKNNEIINNQKEIANNSFLTLMLEDESGNYVESTSNTWPGEGYIFNKELSKCQNGGKLDYDSKNNEFDSYYNMIDISNANNLTIEGVGTDATINQFGFTFKKSSYIEVRNLTFTNNPEDACSFEGDTKNPTLYGYYFVHHNFQIKKG